MNKFTAGEIVLRGPKYVTCVTCGGKGSTFREEWDWQGSESWVSCFVCAGSGQLVSPIYLKALKCVRRKKWVFPDAYQLKHVFIWTLLCFFATRGNLLLTMAFLVVFWLLAYVGRNWLP